jgi:aspartate aminotransferase-like enzyme
METKAYFPGPTKVRENVRQARSLETMNPDMDPEFYGMYSKIGNDIGKIIGTDNQVLILSGEGILGLEAACASLTEPGDRVLVLDNGIFGEGFADFVTIYGGIPVVLKFDRLRAIDTLLLQEYLEKDHDFKYATIVHCDTPSGVLNPIAEICPMLKSYGVMSVVDAVASSGGEPVDVDRNMIDICLGASQKAFSAPVGLTFASVSEAAFRSMEGRKTPIASYYMNLLSFKDSVAEQWFPYSMPASDILGLRCAVDNILEEGIIEFQGRHRRLANAVRNAVVAYGLRLHLDSGFSNTVTVVEMPDGIDIEVFLKRLKQEKGLLLSGSIGYLKNKVVRIGHMGENANEAELMFVLEAMDSIIESMGYRSADKLKNLFMKHLG